MTRARALRWLVSGAEIIGRRISNALNPHVQLEETLNVLMRPTDDGRIHKAT